MKKLSILAVILIFCVFIFAGCKNETETTATSPEVRETVNTAQQTSQTPDITEEGSPAASEETEEPSPTPEKIKQIKPERETQDSGKVKDAKSDHLGFIITTKKGEIRGELYPDTAPNTVLNFVTLAKKGYYNGLTFHRVVPGFVIQGGDPKGDGTGGPGYSIPAEFNKRPHVLGALAMARAQDPDSAGSQFYICIAECRNLDGNYTVFGQVTRGIEIALATQVGDKIESIKITGELPKKLQGKEIKKSNI